MWWFIGGLAVLLALGGLAFAGMVTLARRGMGFERRVVMDNVTYLYIVKFNHPLPQWIGRLRGKPIHEFVWGNTVFVPGAVLLQGTHAHAFKHVIQNAEYDRWGGAEFELYYLRALFCHGYGVRLWAEREAKAFGKMYALRFDELRLIDGKCVVTRARAA